MILVDTNIFIDFWRNPKDEIKNILENENIYVCGVVKAELLLGAKDIHSYKKISAALNCFPEVLTNVGFWDDLSTYLFNMKIKGVTVPFQDAMIATIAISNNLKLWTRDKHFYKMKEILTNLELFEINS